jgi:hypothetical protein
MSSRSDAVTEERSLCAAQPGGGVRAAPARDRPRSHTGHETLGARWGTRRYPRGDRARLRQMRREYLDETTTAELLNTADAAAQAGRAGRRARPRGHVGGHPRWIIDPSPPDRTSNLLRRGRTGRTGCGTRSSVSPWPRLNRTSLPVVALLSRTFEERLCGYRLSGYPATCSEASLALVWLMRDRRAV